MEGQVNVSTANLYAEGAYNSETISQAILGEQLLIQDNDDDFTLIQTSDGYSGWISNFQWVQGSPKKSDKVLIRSHFTSIYSEPDNKSPKIRDAVIGTKLSKTDEKPKWIQVKLPDGVCGWIEEADLGKHEKNTQKNMLRIAHEFLGYPYLWGGKTPKGFDCSGLVQVIFALIGVQLRRDSWMQHHDLKMVTEDPAQGQIGELYFFAEIKKKISHVGISLGGYKILHARGFVRINSLNPTDTDFDQELLETFIDVRTCFD